jgi:hypothetical protein
MGRQRPRTVSRAVLVQWLLVAVSGLLTLLTVLMREDLLRAWVDSNATAREIVGEGGLEALDQSAISVPSFAPVAVVSFVVYGLLAWVLAVLFSEGHGWARWSLVLLAASHLFGMVVIWRAGPPAAFLVLVVVGVLLDLLVGWLLLQRETADWIRAVELAEEQPTA